MQWLGALPQKIGKPFWTAFASLSLHCEHGSSGIGVVVVLPKRDRIEESVESVQSCVNVSTPPALDSLRTVSKSMSALTTGHSIGMSHPRSCQVLDGRAACWR